MYKVNINTDKSRIQWKLEVNFMIQIKKESVVKTYRGKDILIETIKQFHYSTEEEKIEHCKLMEEDGFTDSGQVKENIGTVM